MSDKLGEDLTLFTEYLRAFHKKSYNSKFSKHLLENQHFIDTIDKIMEIFYTAGKCLHLGTVEKYYILGETLYNNQPNDQNTIEQNAIFGIILFQVDH